uniref:Integral membrane protein GPR155 n=1 Tax=Trichobilharzia regenti TaxID=157069 RepID=A0AA85JA23_TRIRE|nr:unnamed protein product [Trichobilharzia regenti]
MFRCYFPGISCWRWKILPESQAKGLGSYVTKFALPSVFFRAMVTMNFAGVCWLFVLAVSISKLIAFLMAMIFTFLISRRCHLGIAAIVAMFVSQSNDVALAYPILNALFPDLASYVYLFAPVQLVVLNPFAYFLLELERVKSTDEELTPLVARDRKEKKINGPGPSLTLSRSSRFRQFAKVLFNVLKNPLFFMTVIGVIFNFILKHHLPIYLDTLLKVIADSFCATALFSLGYGMVGKMATITQREGYILTTILLTKLLVVPFITRELVVQLMPASLTNETLRYSTFGFLYGTTPTAPPVYLFAAEYQVIPVAIGIGLVLGTFLCAPIMFIFAQIITLYAATPSDYVNILGKTVEDVSWISIVCCLWTLGIIYLGKKISRVPIRFTLGYLICVLLSCTGLLLGRLVHSRYDDAGKIIDVNQSVHWSNYIQFVILYYGCTGTRCWTTLIAVVLLMERVRSLCFVLRHQMYIYAVGVTLPAVITVILLLTSPGQMMTDIDPVFQFGTNQLIISLVVLVLNAAITLACLIAFKRMEAPVYDSYEITDTSQTGYETSNGQFHQFHNELNSPDDEVTSQRRIGQCNSTAGNSNPTATSAAAASLESCACADTLNYSTLSKCETSCSGGKRQSDQHQHQQQDEHEQKQFRQQIIRRQPPPCSYAGFCDRCDKRQRKECAKILARYCATNQQQSTSSSTPPVSRNQQIPTGPSELEDFLLQENNAKPFHHKHAIFLILTLVTMFFGICLCTWRLVHDAPTGVYIVLEFLDGSLHFGQGVILFVLFGLDTELFLLPMKRL